VAVGKKVKEIFDKGYATFSIQQKVRMGCRICKICECDTVDEPAIQKTKNNMHSNKYKSNDSHNDNAIEGTTIAQKSIALEDISVTTATNAENHVQILVADPQAFNNLIVQQRQQAIDNPSYRSTIKSWHPNSLAQLVETIKVFSKRKNLVDRHWIIFYWIACNIEYDAVSYFAKDYKDQSAEGVFRTRKGVCAGYANIYKYLCDQLQMPCHVVGGYAKGYGFGNQEGVPTEPDHAWNVVEIDHHLYLMESTWGAGHLNKEKSFARKLNSYYFLPRPNEMIYHHLPKDNKWQLLRTPINMTQYLHMPKVHPTYFELNIELVSPLNQAHVDLFQDKPYALVLLRAPSDVQLIADLRLQNEKIVGGHRVIFDHQKQLYSCYFAPSNIGKHKITIYGKRRMIESKSYDEMLDLTLDVKQMPQDPISFPETWEKYFDLGLEVITPQNTHLIKVNNGATHAEIRIKTPDNVELLGQLMNTNAGKVIGGNRVYYDRRKNIWRCNFAPDRDDIFEALIMAKKKNDPGGYTSVVSFKIEAKQIQSPPLSYPETWQLFYDLGLKIEAPRNRSKAVWADNASYAEVLIQAPDDIELLCSIEYNNVTIENGSLAQFDSNKKLWQLLFAPEQTGLHELIVYGKRNAGNELSSAPVVKFYLDVTNLRRPMKFPLIYTKFQTNKCQIYTPMNGILKKGSVVPIHCVIPGAIDVNLMVDSNWLKSEGYKDPILQRQITVGSKEVAIYAKYDQKSNYDGLVNYAVQ
jgi:hypothetical protein